MAVTQQLESLVRQMPDPDDRGMYSSQMDKQKIDDTVAALRQGGRDYALGLIEMLSEPGSEANVKPHYALHCLVNHVLVVQDQQARVELCTALGSQLGGDLPHHVQTVLCQELGWAGRGESISALGRVLTDEQLCAPAAAALVAIGAEAAGELRAAWPKVKGSSRHHILDGLVALSDPESVTVFLEALHDEDREVRVAAGAGLAKLGQSAAVDHLLKTADAAEGWERIQATTSCLVLAEKLAANGHPAEARHIYQHLQQTRTEDSEQHLQEAAQRGLAALA